MGNSRPVISGSTPNRWGRLRRAPSPILGRSKKSNAMRISDLTPSVVMLGAFVGLMPAFALDGTPSDGVPSVNGAPPVGVDRLPSGSGATPAAAPARGVEMPRPPGAVPAAPGAGRAPLVSPVEAFRSGTQALRAGEKDKAVTSLQYAAEQGHALAQWKLGRMYAEGDGVERSDRHAPGSLRGQRLRGARPLLSRGHPQLAHQGGRGARPRDVLLRGLVFRRSR